MKILIVEDDDNKSKQITQYLTSVMDGVELTIRKSYQSGVREILTVKYDLMLLDMSMPTYDISPTEPGWKFRLFGGEDILREMKRKKINVKAIVVTQYDSFGEDNKITTDELNKRLSMQFPDIYLGLVYYNASFASWKDNLYSMINHNH